ncbi:hypothetical protein BDB00DRAFT_788223 [Zychaea mexicana]|uniref:uncharacterized protein n=1 Tax=Zychaea mexicana TaxID=64656 RepID=UPI0022FF1E8D|nr:uncharacterized protein BDB00DRAFT_788223 [Zychaea mexicana]KAI9493178.1 hypothetical protein BDB00DRAFT_788223 [Zychaea mexicana]
MTLTSSNSTSTSATAPSPKRSKSLQLQQSLPPKKPSKKKSAEHNHQQKAVSKRQSRSDSELTKSAPTIRTPQRRRRSNSAAVVRTNYAGPVFNNAPEPSSLPLPTFFSPQPQRLQPPTHHHHQYQRQPQQRPRTTSFHTIDEHKPYFPAKMATAHPPSASDPSLIELQQRLCSVLKLGASP